MLKAHKILPSTRRLILFAGLIGSKKTPCKPKDFKTFDYKALKIVSDRDECLPLCNEETYLASSTSGLIDEELLSKQFKDNTLAHLR